MHAQNNWSSRDAAACNHCRGTGRTDAARAADQLLLLPAAEQRTAFEGMEAEARSRLLEADANLYEALSEHEMLAVSSPGHQL